MTPEFNFIVGQELAKRKLEFLCKVFQHENRLPRPILFEGPSGCGKTAFALALSKAMGRKTLEINATVIGNVKKFQDHVYLPFLADGDTEFNVFVDEAHAMNSKLIDFFLTVFGNPDEQIVSVAGPDGGEMVFDFRRMSFLFGTTDPDALPVAFLSRMEFVNVDPYKQEELGQIICKNFHENDLSFTNSALNRLGAVARSNARDAKELARLITSFCKINNFQEVSDSVLDDYFYQTGTLAYGMKPNEKKILDILSDGPKTLNYICAKTGLTKGAVQQSYEKFLRMRGFIDIDGKRHITKAGLEARMARP